MIIGTAVVWLAHEAVCIATRHPEELITRVIARWRKRHRLLVDGTIYYLAGHLTDLWQHDPLALRETA